MTSSISTATSVTLYAPHPTYLPSYLCPYPLQSLQCIRFIQMYCIQLWHLSVILRYLHPTYRTPHIPTTRLMYVPATTFAVPQNNSHVSHMIMTLVSDSPVSTPCIPATLYTCHPTYLRTLSNVCNASESFWCIAYEYDICQWFCGIYTLHTGHPTHLPPYMFEILHTRSHNRVAKMQRIPEILGLFPQRSH